jgi:peptide/nickel transport system substrate-binding protein
VHILRNGTRGPRRRRPKTALLGAVALTLVVSACGGDDGEGDAGNQDGPTTLVVGVADLGTENWSPYIGLGAGERPVTYGVMERLIQTDPETREYVPGLAESWESNEDSTEWTFTLRDDVPFHPGPDGQDYGMMTAEDVKFSLGLVMRDDSVLGRSDAYRQMIDNDMDNIEIVDDHTFRLHLPAPNAIVPSLFSSTTNTVPVTSQAYWEEVGEDAASDYPVGTGPWKFDSFQPGTSATLTAFEDHWRKTPDFDEIQYRIIPDESAMLAQLQTNEIDMAALPLELVPDAEEQGLRVVSVPNVGVSSIYLGGWYPDSEFYDPDSPWIQADNPERGRAIREAMSVAIDRTAIVESLLGGQAEEVVAPVHFVGGIMATNEEWVGDGAQVPEFDPERARELLAEGGYPDGFDVTTTTFPQPGLPQASDITAAMVSMLADVGINVETRQMQEPEYDEMREARATSGNIWQYIQQPLADEPADRFSAFLPSDAGAEFFLGPLAEYIDRMRAEPDYEARMGIAREMGQEMVDCVCPAIGIAAVSSQWVMGPDVGDWQYLEGLPEIHNTEYIAPAS